MKATSLFVVLGTAVGGSGTLGGAATSDAAL